MPKDMPLTDEEKAIYEWQMWVPDFGEQGQEKLKGASVLVSRVGGVGSVVAYELAAAGVGKLVLAHAGNVKPSDLNRQLLMTYDWLGKPRVQSARRRLHDLNPRIEIETIEENLNEDNAHKIIEKADMVVDCAPLFEERLAMNRAIVEQGKPMVDSAMYDMEAQLTTILPGKSACLACLYPQKPPLWKRQFPVFGAVSGTIACLAAVEAIKVLAGVGTPLTNRLLSIDMRLMMFRALPINRNPQCSVCSSL